MNTFCFSQIVIEQRIKAFEVRDITAAYLRPDRQSVSVGDEVDLGREVRACPQVLSGQNLPFQSPFCAGGQVMRPDDGAVDHLNQTRTNLAVVECVQNQLPQT